MIYDQAIKFLNKRVFVIREDQTVIRGRLTKVGGDGYVTIVSNMPESLSYRVHLKYVFPQK